MRPLPLMLVALALAGCTSSSPPAAPVSPASADPGAAPPATASTPPAAASAGPQSVNGTYHSDATISVPVAGPLALDPAPASLHVTAKNATHATLTATWTASTGATNVNVPFWN